MMATEDRVHISRSGMAAWLVTLTQHTASFGRETAAIEMSSLWRFPLSSDQIMVWILGQITGEMGVSRTRTRPVAKRPCGFQHSRASYSLHHCIFTRLSLYLSSEWSQSWVHRAEPPADSDEALFFGAIDEGF
jgi:hypothetical protein